MGLRRKFAGIQAVKRIVGKPEINPKPGNDPCRYMPLYVDAPAGYYDQRAGCGSISMVRPILGRANLG
jgi:hypothetical protein